MRIAVITQSKGGTGKTTTAINLATGLAAAGKQVLLVDCDPQGNVATSLGLTPLKTLYHLYIDRVPWLECILKARENLDVIPCDRNLSAVEQWLVMQNRREEILRRRLELLEGYDFVILDTAPSFSLTGLNAMLLAEEAWVPVSMEYLSLEGLRQVAGNLRVVEEELQHSLPIRYVIPTFLDSRNKKSREVLGILEQAYGKRVTAPIRQDVRISEAPSFHQSIFEHAPGSRGALDYQAIVERIANDVSNEHIPNWKKPAQHQQERLRAGGGQGGEYPEPGRVIYAVRSPEKRGL